MDGFSRNLSVGTTVNLDNIALSLIGDDHLLRRSSMKCFRLAVVVSITTWALFSGCAQTTVWTSSPTFRLIENPYYNARFEPVMWGANVKFFNAFRLTITNKTAEALTVDWTNTLYMVNGKPFSRFVWEGIGKENVNNPPPDVIAAGKEFSRLVVPLKLIAWKPLGSASEKAAFTAGPLLEGRNGIDLIVRQENQQVRERITLDIRTK